MTYKLQANGYVMRLADGAWIPPVEGNADWREYQEWLAIEGNEPLAADPPPPPSPIIDGMTFLARVTDAEYSAVLQAAQTDAKVARWIDQLRMQGRIDLSSTAAAAAKAYLVAQGLLDPARANIIFALPQ